MTIFNQIIITFYLYIYIYKLQKASKCSPMQRIEWNSKLNYIKLSPVAATKSNVGDNDDIYIYCYYIYIWEWEREKERELNKLLLK